MLISGRPPIVLTLSYNSCGCVAALQLCHLQISKKKWSSRASRAKAPNQEGASPSAILSKASTTRRPPAIYHIDRPNPQHSMSAPVSRALRRCVCTAKPNSSYLRPTAAFAQQRIAQRWQSTDAAAAPTNPKIATIVDQISQLTLLETADLVSTLKVRQQPV